MHSVHASCTAPVEPRGTGVRLDAGQVQALVEGIDAEQGRPHVLVNDVWGGELLSEWNAPCGSTTSTMACGCCDSILRLGFRAGRGARAARLHCGGAHAGLDALGDDARALRGHRGELARRSGHEPAFGLLALPGRGPGGGPAGGSDRQPLIVSIVPPLRPCLGRGPLTMHGRALRAPIRPRPEPPRSGRCPSRSTCARRRRARAG